MELIKLLATPSFNAITALGWTQIEEHDALPLTWGYRYDVKYKPWMRRTF